MCVHTGPYIKFFYNKQIDKHRIHFQFMKLPFKNTGISEQTIPHYEFFSHTPRRPGTSQIHKHGCRSWKALEI